MNEQTNTINFSSRLFYVPVTHTEKNTFHIHFPVLEVGVKAISLTYHNT